MTRARNMLLVMLVVLGALAPVASASASSGAAPVAQTPATSATSTAASTPYMGWNTYYGVGGVFDQRTIVSVARALIRRGLARAGYRIVWLDFGWATGQRTPQGTLVLDGRHWPKGMQWLTGWLHSHGLLAGIYTDAGASGCYHRGVGSLHHYAQDANTFAAWGFDAVKVDFCGAGQEGLDPRPLYRRFAGALRHNESHRPMLLNVCNFWVPGQIDGKRPSYANSSFANALWAPRIAQSWRTDTDIGGTGSILFKNVLRNLDRDAVHPRAARPGHWNDPDYLGPQLGMSQPEARTQLTMWAMVAAPLILGSDPRKLSSASVRMLENRALLRVDQDPLGRQGTPLPGGGPAQVWVKPLSGGDRAIALLNRGDAPATITTTARAVGIARAPRYRLENLWSHTGHLTSGRIRARVPAHAALLYRLTAL